jgi:hypothetical protein
MADRQIVHDFVPRLLALQETRLSRAIAIDKIECALLCIDGDDSDILQCLEKVPTCQRPCVI